MAYDGRSTPRHERNHDLLRLSRARDESLDSDPVAYAIRDPWSQLILRTSFQALKKAATVVGFGVQ
ncbi:UNVERIFIED_CONTAM: hypothetical protein NCL1_46529 [Trichonephila clavipes]